MEEGSTPVERGVARGYGQARDARNVEMGQRRQQHQALKELSAKMQQEAMKYRRGYTTETGEFVPGDMGAYNDLMFSADRYNSEADTIIPSYRDAQGNVIAAGNAENAKDYYDPAQMRRKVDTDASHALYNQQAQGFVSPVDAAREQDFQLKKGMLENTNDIYATYKINGKIVDPRDVQKDVYKPGFNADNYVEDQDGRSVANDNAMRDIVQSGDRFFYDSSPEAQSFKETYPDIYASQESYENAITSAADRLASGNVGAEEREQILSGLPNNVRLNILKLEDIQERRKKLQTNPDSAYDAVAIDPNTGEPVYTERDDMQTTYNKAFGEWRTNNPMPVDDGTGNYIHEYNTWLNKWHAAAREGVVPKLTQTYGADQMNKALGTRQGWKGGKR